jgi:hypothetical protein
MLLSTYWRGFAISRSKGECCRLSAFPIERHDTHSLIQHHQRSEYSDRALDQFEQIYADSATSARVMALVVHPEIMGAPHRLKYFRRVLETIGHKSDVKLWTGAQLADWYKANNMQV